MGWPRRFERRHPKHLADRIAAEVHDLQKPEYSIDGGGRASTRPSTSW